MTDVATITGGAALARLLSACDVRDVYGLPSGKFSPFVKALAESDQFRYVGVRHEASAAWMAAATRQATGRLAMCFAETGGGAANLVAGLVSAHGNHIPVLVMTPGVPTHLSYPFTGVLMQSDNERLFSAVTKWRAVVRDVNRLPELVRQAVREATTGAPGPVYLEIPVDILDAALDVDGLDLEVPIGRFVLSGRAHGDPVEVRAAAALLLEARRPLIIAGGGVISSDAATATMSLARHLGAAVTGTQMALGVIPSDDAAFFGHGGNIGGEAVVRALREADVVLALGCRFSSWLWDGSLPLTPGWPDQKVIQVDINPSAIGARVSTAIGIQGDVAAVVAQLLSDIGSASGDADDEWLASLVEEHREYLTHLHALAAESADVMHPAAVAIEIARALPPNALAVYDGGHTSFWSNDLTPVSAPGTRFHEPAAGHLGFGLPYALALKQAFPDRPVINITGDGAFGFSLQELDTARRHRLAAVTVIHNNGAWGVIAAAQQRQGFAFGVELGGTDYADIARAFGCHGERVERRDDVAPAVSRALASGRPAVVDVQTRFEPHPGLARFGAAGRR